MRVITVPRDSMDAVRAAVHPPTSQSRFTASRSETPPPSLCPRPQEPSAAALLEGVLLHDPATAQRALAALICDEMEGSGPAQVIVLPDSRWAVDLPKVSGVRHGVVVAPRMDGDDIDGVYWEVLPRKKDGGPRTGARPMVEEQMGVRPAMVHELLGLVGRAVT